MASMTQIYTALNTVQSQAWGSTAVAVVDTKSMIALGNYILDSSNVASKDLWTSTLTDYIAKTIFVSKPLTGQDLGITRDETDFGAVLRKVRVKPKALEYNEEYDLAADDTYDPFKITVPEVNEQLYSKHTTYKSQITITDKQLFTAFQSDADMQAFYSLLFKQLDDSMYRAQMNYDRMALVNFIAEKLVLQGTQATKTHAINLLQAYKDETGTTLTVAQAWNNADFLKFFANQMLLYKGYMNADTDTFNSSVGYPSQTPDSYMNFYVLNYLDSKLKTNLYADTYNKEMVTVAGYKTVDFWQGIKGATGAAFSPLQISKIDVTPASGGAELSKTGILAVMVDKDAVVSTYRREASESWRIPLKGTNHARTNTHMYINDLYENGIVFYIEDLA